jgi:hypothetical protein
MWESEKVIAYGARKLSRSQQNYAPTKRELWAIVHFCCYWRYFLQHRSVPFIISTDHHSLQYMEGMEPPSGMIMRWFDTMSNFNFSIEHRPGKKHANADPLSRCAHAEEPDPDDEPDEMIAMMHEMISVLEPCVPDWDTAHIRSQQLMDSDQNSCSNSHETYPARGASFFTGGEGLCRPIRTAVFR